MEDLLKAWLDELLFCYATRQLVLTRIKTLECSEGELAGKVLMDRFDPVHYETKNEIKAVTYHELKVARVRNHWEATIIFDV
jgi:SHS2 domain-containing protein